MNCEQYDASLSEYVDGTLQSSEEPLDVARLDAVEAHLANCERCRAVVEDLHALGEAARQLERRVPPAHVWPSIAATVAGERPQRVWSWQMVAAAAMVVVVLGGGWMAWRQLTTPPAAATIGAVSPAEPQPDPELVQDVETELKLAEEHYVKAIAGLEAIAKAEGSELDPQTADVMQANLRVIDAAIGDSRAALQTDPSSDLAQDSLFGALRSKVTLLQDTIALINEMRKGNQEGAARIVSGLNQ
jgi:hypothetical protein